MQRKQFLASSMSILPVLAFPQLVQKKEAPKKPFVIAAGKGRFNESFLFKGKSPNDIKISKSDTGNQLAVFEYIGYEKTGPALHLHFFQDEIFYVAAGEYRFVVGEDTLLLKAGDTIFLPRNIPHTWIQLTDTGKLLYFVQPAGKMEEFFRTMNNFKHPPTQEEIDSIHKAHDLKVVGPPLTL
jgi:quercetin 2,3-dioxygenase